RDAALLGLLFRAAPGRFGLDAHRPLLAAVLRREDPDLTALALGNLEKFIDPSNAYAVLSAVRGLPDPQRDAVVGALVRGLTARGFAGFTANNLDVFSRVDPWLCRASWRILAAGTAPPEVLTELWRRILSATEPTDDSAARTSSPDALTALARSGIPTDEVAAALTERPFLVALLSPETFADVLRRTPPVVALQIIAASADDQWARLRPALVRALAEGFGGVPFWAAMPKAMESDPEERLVARLLGDEEIAASFLSLDDVEGVLGIREPAFGPLLARWAERYVTALPRDSATLLTAATHELPEVRSAGLARAASVGMGLPFALGLMESEVPPSVEGGKAFFEADQTDDGDRAYPYALALLDSPRASVRAWGREYAAARLNRVSHAALCRALFENPNPDVQAFAADLVAGGLSGGAPPAEAATAGEPLSPPQTAQFDGEVLRQRNRSRRAKEKIKARQSAAPAPTVDVETLLSLARGADGTARDAEWALAQLARLALSGQTVEGLTLEAVPGAEATEAAGSR
ncbi:MAG TPA: hypothetical protein VM490_12455, partial [Armatimonadaceae bacterium]|nr:hypothetical protein [Armatimonadaceae bacterium]